MEADRRMMSRALELAAKGAGQVSPGPLVGCVIVSPEGKVIGEGFYVYDELKHAETLALERAGGNAKGSTTYVSLEPHAHHGRTPPCTDLLIAAGIRRVVAPIEDPNPQVSGRGFDHLRAAGLEVTSGLMAAAAERLNEKYLHSLRTGRPFIHLKLATSLDGKIATRSGDSRWITGEQSRARVHELRHEYDAILIGAGTAMKDDPLLTDRSGQPRRRPLLRVVLDEKLQVSSESLLVKTAPETPTLVFAGRNADPDKIKVLESQGVEIILDNFNGPNGANGRDLLSVVGELAKRSVQSVLIEGGAGIAGKFLDAGLVNKVSFFIAPVIIGGREAPNAIDGTGTERIVDATQLEDVEIVRHGPDIEVTGYPSKAKDEG